MIEFTVACLDCKDLAEAVSTHLLMRDTHDRRHFHKVYAFIGENPLRNGLPNVNGGGEASGYKGVLKENEAP